MKTKKAPATESGDPVGSQLSVARLRLGWTLEEASSRTRLHHNILRQLEAGQFDKLPSLAYTRGFLRIYSRELGLDPKILLRELLRFSGEAETMSVLERGSTETERMFSAALRPRGAVVGMPGR